MAPYNARSTKRYFVLAASRHVTMRKSAGVGPGMRKNKRYDQPLLVLDENRPIAMFRMAFVAHLIHQRLNQE